MFKQQLIEISLFNVSICTDNFADCTWIRVDCISKWRNERLWMHLTWSACVFGSVFLSPSPSLSLSPFLFLAVCLSRSLPNADGCSGTMIDKQRWKQWNPHRTFNIKQPLVRFPFRFLPFYSPLILPSRINHFRVFWTFLSLCERLQLWFRSQMHRPRTCPIRAQCGKID